MKIDGSLIANIATPGDHSERVVEAIITLCRTLGICTVAEAVETAQQVAVLRRLGADVAQGYFFSPPLSAEDAFMLSAMEPLPCLDLAVPAARRLKAEQLKAMLDETHRGLAALVDAVHTQNRILEAWIQSPDGLFSP
jgi:predicted signal transduction protein with EAL and GGDEF domain